MLFMVGILSHHNLDQSSLDLNTHQALRQDLVLKLRNAQEKSQESSMLNHLSRTKTSYHNELLERYILAGIGYHHAGMFPHERQVIEIGFKEGLLSILAATSTLAAGVNLPAGRVVIQSLKIGELNKACLCDHSSYCHLFE
jgi:DNA polymerase theta